MAARPESITDRLVRLEMQQRVWKVFTLTACLAAAIAVFFSRGERIESRLVAEEFRLVDKSGSVRAVLGITSQGPALSFRDVSNRPRAVFGVGAADGPGVVLADPAGKPRAELVIRKGSPTLAFGDAGGAVRAELQLRPEGPVLALSGGSIQLLDREGKLLVRIPQE